MKRIITRILMLFWLSPFIILGLIGVGYVAFLVFVLPWMSAVELLTQ